MSEASSLPRCFGLKTEGWPSYYYGVIGLASGLNLVAFGVCWYAEGAMLSRRRVRSNAFNLYVVFLLLPDTLNNLVQSLQGLVRASDCGKTTPLVSDVFDANVFCYYVCNFSMSCLVAYELHALLERSRNYIRTGPPSVKRTLLQIAGVYALAILFTLWGILDVSWSWWYRKKSRFGSPPGGVFHQIESMGMVAALMLAFIAFVLAIRFRIWRKQLIPKRGRTRVVALFFQHIVGVFLVFYLPSIALLAYSTRLKGHTSAAYFWIERSSQLLAALQALATVGVAVQKPDIRAAICCGREAAEPGPRWSIFGSSNNNNGTRRWTVVSGHRFSVFRGSGKRRTTHGGGGMALPPASDTTNTRRTESETQRPTTSAPNEKAAVAPSEAPSSRFRNSSHELASRSYLARASEWVMDDVYGDTQISSGVVEDDENADGNHDVVVEDVIEERDGTNAVETDDEGMPQQPTERRLGQRLVASTIESEEIVFGPLSSPED